MTAGVQLGEGEGPNTAVVTQITPPPPPHLLQHDIKSCQQFVRVNLTSSPVPPEITSAVVLHLFQCGESNMSANTVIRVRNINQS